MLVHPPVVDRALVGHGVEEHQDHAEEPVGLERTMRPEAVYPAGDAKPTATRYEKCRGDYGDSGAGQV